MVCSLFIHWDNALGCDQFGEDMHYCPVLRKSLLSLEFCAFGRWVGHAWLLFDGAGAPRTE